MNRLFIIGASILQLPAIKKAKAMGLYVGVADYNPNAIGIPFADEYYNVSTIDEEGVYRAAKKFKADGIMTLATDMPMRAVAYACDKLNLTGISYDTAIKSTDKGEMIKAFKANDVESPWYYIIENEIDLIDKKNMLTFPCIIKPTDNAGSRGVDLVNSIDELDKSYQYSREQSRSGKVIIEEYLQGNEVSVEVMVYKGTPHILAITDKLTTGSPYFVEMGHSQPSQLPDDSLNNIRDLASRACRAVGIENGPAHVEIMNTSKGPRMVELGARMGGDCITTHLVPLSTGIDMIKATIDCALGEEPDLSQILFKGCAIRYFNVPKGTIKSISGVEDAKTIAGIQEIVFTKNIGDSVTGIHSSLDRVGFVIAQAATAAEAIKRCNDTIEKIKIVVEI